MLDNEIFISKIENYHAIWNTASQEYHNKTLKEQSWNSVCEELTEDWNTLSSADKYEKCIELKKKWINIRDYYKKELARVRASEAGRAKQKRKKYVYFNILSFLQPIYNRTATESVAGDQTDNDQTCDEPTNKIENQQMDNEQTYNELIDCEPIYDEKIYNEQMYNKQLYNEEVDNESDQPLTSLAPQPSLLPPRKKKKKPTKLNPFESSLVDALKMRYSPMEEFDSDLHFLKSLLPDINKLTDTQKLDFKLGALQLLKNIKATKSQV